MQVKWVFGVLPAFVSVTSKLEMRGITNFNVVRIQKDLPDTVTLEHELVHVRQNYVLFGLLSGLLALLYFFISSLFVVGAAVIILGILFATKELREFSMECAAYAVSSKEMVKQRGTSIEDAILLCVSDYDNGDFYLEDRSYEEIKRRIERRVADGWIF